MALVPSGKSAVLETSVESGRGAGAGGAEPPLVPLGACYRKYHVVGMSGRSVAHTWWHFDLILSRFFALFGSRFCFGSASLTGVFGGWLANC